MKSDYHLRMGIAEHFATKYKRIVDLYDDGTGLLFVTVRSPGMTDSFKLVVNYLAPSFHVEVAGKIDTDASHDFVFPSFEIAADAYMLLFTFFTERVMSRCQDI
jgi:hypothetical protein